ncbi:MAG TPA: hypothetical protein VJ771_01435 [Candidatus Nitrosotalea sp.]|nr:hypothetical protein [Candidatus Nitrosotalea sp.]
MFPILRNDSQTPQEVKTFHVSTATLEQPTNTTTKTEGPTLLTFDADWCPDFMMEYVYDIIKDTGIKSTWFMTNKSDLIYRLQEDENVELGVHPNFNHDSTQGATSHQIMENLLKIVPNAESVRTHGLLQSTNILSLFNKYGIKNDSSLLFPLEKEIRPHQDMFSRLTRFPIYWADDVMMQQNKMGLYVNNQGLKVYLFHPIHIYLNSADMESYENMKRFGQANLNKDNVKKFIGKSFGTRNLFVELIEYLKKQETFTIKEFSDSLPSE